MQNIYYIGLVITIMSNINNSQSQYCGQSVLPYVSRPGDVILIGLFDVQRGDRCDSLQRGGFEQMYSAVWLIDWLNNRTYTKGIRMGLNFYDTCSDVQSAMKLTVHGLYDSKYLETEECRSELILGFVGPFLNPAKSSVSDLLHHLTIAHVPFSLKTLQYEIEALIALLNRLEWKRVALISSSEDLRSSFHLKAAPAKICVEVSEIVDKDDFTKFDHSFRLIRKTGLKVLVALTTDSDLLESLRTARLHNLTHLYWLVAGPTVHSSHLVNLDGISSSALIVAQPTEDNYPTITTSFIRRSVRMSSKGEQLLNKYLSAGMDCRINASMHRDPLCRLYQMHVLDSGIESVLKSILRMADALKHLHAQNCGGSWNICSTLRQQFERKMWKLLPSMPSANTDILREVIKDEKPISFWSYQPSPSFFNFVEVGRFVRSNLRLESHILNILQPVGAGWYKIPDFQCTDDCACINQLPDKLSEASVIWKSDTWITICVTVSCAGTVMALAFACYIIVRICRKDTIQGSQGFALCIIFGIIFSYVSILPYGFEPSENICALRHLLSAAYAFLFAPILSRCLMLATSDAGGLPGHISGLIQSALYIFAVGVQAALSAQYWWLNCGVHSLSNPSRCAASKNTIIISMLYPSLLLLLWLMVAPFCVKSRRNYREGLCFQIASILSLSVWVTWISLFFIFPDRWRDACLCLGMVATATVILLSVFVPRLYKMTTLIALDAVNVNLRPIGQLLAPNLTEMRTRDLRSMYDNASHAYVSEPSNHTTMKDDMTGTIGTVYEECPGSVPKTTHL